MVEFYLFSFLESLKRNIRKACNLHFNFLLEFADVFQCFTNLLVYRFLHKSQLPSSGVTHTRACKGQTGDVEGLCRGAGKCGKPRRISFPTGAAATQSRQIVAGQKCTTNNASSCIFQKKLGFIGNLPFLNVSN